MTITKYSSTRTQAGGIDFLLRPPSKMQFKTTSLVAIAVWLAGAASASALNARGVAPIPQQAAVAHVYIHPILDSSLCFTPSGVNQNSQVVLSACTNSASQIWGVNTLDNANVVQFQNAANNLCFEMNADPFSGQIISVSGCSNSDGSGRPVSNTEFNTSPQTITAGNLPIVLTAINNRIHFTDSGFCVDRSGNGLVFNRCNGALSQTWLLTAA
ncbi:hypothetical protein C8J57DRAFT_1515921 [Mycena rebaudengoi]|nr:hypothetical protein C8J57DRAFT_1515921 [Mycena rebaudengoi]